MSNQDGTSRDQKEAAPKKAVALSYDSQKDSAPRVLASGRGLIAEQILNIAHQHELPIKDDPILVEALSHVDINETIPPELYAVVAEVFAFVYRLKKKKLD
jgi:flagellar biosynthesis protein